MAERTSEARKSLQSRLNIELQRELCRSAQLAAQLVPGKSGQQTSRMQKYEKLAGRGIHIANQQRTFAVL